MLEGRQVRALQQLGIQGLARRAAHPRFQERSARRLFVLFAVLGGGGHQHC